ncbi:hypothetical protein [Erythrobacter sp.]|uniref:hypothetical protein n=1 Tax=Erythrobacter sp. TaxID=1042 RepID=UPI003C7115EF
MSRLLRNFVMVLALVVPGAQLIAQTLPDPRETLERAVAAHGGEAWLSPETLQLVGTAVFYDPETGRQRAVADDYRMWRVFDADRTKSHDASGKVRIVAREGERTIFEVGYDGTTTWTERGIMPKQQADAYWANNFGFGIVRQALGDGFALHNAPTRDVAGRPTRIVRIVDPAGAQTLFGFDEESGFITYLAFDTPRGFHERVYAGFVTLDNGWVQARSVTLFYDGIMSNSVFWSVTRVGEPIDDALFAPPE